MARKNQRKRYQSKRPQPKQDRKPAASPGMKKYLKGTDISDVPPGKVPSGPLSDSTLSNIAQVDANAAAAIEDAKKPIVDRDVVHHPDDTLADVAEGPYHTANFIETYSPDDFTKRRVKRQVKAAIRNYESLQLQEAMRQPPKEL